MGGLLKRIVLTNASIASPTSKISLKRPEPLGNQSQLGNPLIIFSIIYYSEGMETDCIEFLFLSILSKLSNIPFSETSSTISAVLNFRYEVLLFIIKEGFVE